MKISSDVNRISKIYSQNTKAVKQTQAKTTKEDRIDISSTGRELSKYVDAALKSDIKSPNFDEVKKLVDNNNYKVDSSKLAQSILDQIKERDV